MGHSPNKLNIDTLANTNKRLAKLTSLQIEDGIKCMCSVFTGHRGLDTGLPVF